MRKLRSVSSHVMPQVADVVLGIQRFLYTEFVVFHPRPSTQHHELPTVNNLVYCVSTYRFQNVYLMPRLKVRLEFEPGDWSIQYDMPIDILNASSPTMRRNVKPPSISAS